MELWDMRIDGVKSRIASLMAPIAHFYIARFCATSLVEWSLSWTAHARGPFPMRDGSAEQRREIAFFLLVHLHQKPPPLPSG